MNRLALKLRFCAAFLLLGLWGADAQTAREQIAAVPERAGGIYHSYEYRPAAAAPAPDGYTPFYISHYGRHGSRCPPPRPDPAALVHWVFPMHQRGHQGVPALRRVGHPVQFIPISMLVHSYLPAPCGALPCPGRDRC